jgi:SAM-dependent methyltransferase
MQSAQFQLHAEIEQRHWWFVARRRIMRQIVREVLPPSRDTTVLDVGCGTGGNIAALAEDYRCVGIDTSAEAVALATQRFPRAEFVCGQAPEYVASLMPDVRMVLLMDVLEHVPDDVGLLGSLARAAAPGTYFLITVPADPRLWSGHDVAFGHYRRYEPQGLRGVWSNLPLELCFTSFFNARLYPLVKLVRTLNRWRGACDIADFNHLDLIEAYDVTTAGDGRVPHTLGLLDGKKGAVPTYYAAVLVDPDGHNVEAVCHMPA